MTVLQLFKSDVITVFPTFISDQLRQLLTVLSETLIPARFSLSLSIKGINITVSKLLILFMHFYFRLSLLEGGVIEDQPPSSLTFFFQTSHIPDEIITSLKLPGSVWSLQFNS